MLDTLLLALPYGIGPWAYLVVQLAKLLPAVITAIKSDPNPNNKSAPIVVDKIKKIITVGEPTELKNI